MAGAGASWRCSSRPSAIRSTIWRNRFEGRAWRKRINGRTEARNWATSALAFVLVTVIAAGGGPPPGLRGAKPRDHPEAAKTAQPEPHGEMKGATGDLTRELPPIVATLSEPKNVWMRLETAIVLDRAALPEADRLAREIT